MKPWSIEECEAYAKQLKDKTRANTAEHAAQAIEYLLGLVRREEAYKHAGHPLPEREWAGLTDEDRQAAFESMPNMLDGFLKTWGWLHFSKAIEAKVKEKNYG